MINSLYFQVATKDSYHNPIFGIPHASFLYSSELVFGQFLKIFQDEIFLRHVEKGNLNKYIFFKKKNLLLDC